MTAEQLLLLSFAYYAATLMVSVVWAASRKSKLSWLIPVGAIDEIIRSTTSAMPDAKQLLYREEIDLIVDFLLLLRST